MKLVYHSQDLPGLILPLLSQLLLGQLFVDDMAVVHEVGAILIVFLHLRGGDDTFDETIHSCTVRGGEERGGEGRGGEGGGRGGRRGREGREEGREEGEGSEGGGEGREEGGRGREGGGEREGHREEEEGRERRRKFLSGRSGKEGRFNSPPTERSWNNPVLVCYTLNPAYPGSVSALEVPMMCLLGVELQCPVASSQGI